MLLYRRWQAGKPRAANSLTAQTGFGGAGCSFAGSVLERRVPCLARSLRGAKANECTRVRNPSRRSGNRPYCSTRSPVTTILPGKISTLSMRSPLSAPISSARNSFACTVRGSSNAFGITSAPNRASVNSICTVSVADNEVPCGLDVSAKRRRNRAACHERVLLERDGPS